MADPTDNIPKRPAQAVVLLSLGVTVAMALTLHRLSNVLPPGRWWDALTGLANDIPSLVFADVAMPRLVASWLAGAGLSVAGLLFQQALRNPLAEAGTLGVSSGAWLALVAATLFAPALLDASQEAVALAGAAAGAAIVFAIARRVAFAPLRLILSGLTVNLFFASAAAVLALLNHEQIGTLFIWQTGSLVQNGWGSVGFLVPRLALGLILAVSLCRPLAMLALDDGHARSLGIPIFWFRIAALAVAVAIGAVVTSALGVVSFVGLAAPHLARAAGVRALPRLLIATPLLGALMLWVVDALVQANPFFNSEISTGSANALIGSPLLLWMLSRSRIREAATISPTTETRRCKRPAWVLAGLSMLLLGALLLAATIGATGESWGWSPPWGNAALLTLRLPRIAAAGAAGASLAVAGMLLQRITGNAMASPELIGASSGAALGIILLLLLKPDFSQWQMLAAGSLGALAALLACFALNRASDFAPIRLLLTGAALTTICTALASVLLTSGDPRQLVLMTWLSGSTYRVDASMAAIATISMVVVVTLAPLFSRWLAILSLGETLPASLGLSIMRSRLAVLALAAGASATATLVVGPLSYVGLMAPQMARMTGLQRPAHQLLGSAAIGASILIAADWLGRNLFFPYQIPAGLLAAFIGGPILLTLLARRTA